MKAKPWNFDGTSYKSCAAADANHVQLHCPGPYPNRFIPVILKGARAGLNCWSWNGDTEKPTLKPSILIRGTKQLTDEEADRIVAGEKIEPVPEVCHTWVNDGQMIFLPDCTHALAGQTVDLLEVE